MSKDLQQPDQTPDPPPRLSIAHLMLLTLTTAVSIAVMNFVAQRWAAFVSPDLPSPFEQVLRVAARVWRAGMVGMELALAGIVLTWIIRKRPTGIAPGHWLLVGLGVEAVLTIVLSGVSVLMLGSEDAFPLPYSWRLCIYASGDFALAAMWLALATRVDRGKWRLVFVLEGLLNIVSIAGWGMLISGQNGGTIWGTFWTAITMLQIGSLGSGATGLLAIVLTLVERRAVRRDWLHMLGVMLLALRLVTAVLSMFVPRM